MIASYLGPGGEELAFDVACLEDFRSLVAQAGVSVLLEHENGSSLACTCAEERAFLVWTDPLHHVYSWQGPEELALECVRAYLASGWPSSDQVRFVHDGT